jgi:hypothetical integral membrane protein (TIGR02206 family)
MTNSAFFSGDIPFESFSQTHVFTLLFSIVLLTLLIIIGRKLSAEQNLLLGRCISVFLSLTVILFLIFHLYFGRFDIAVDLPLSICNLFAFIAPLLFWNPNQKRMEVVYFAVMSGTFQAIITPDLYVGFPTYGFFKYWISHIGLVIIVIHYLLSFQLRPRAKGIFITFIWLNIYLFAIVPINLLLDANYFYLMEKPINPSILDLFGPWPTYILVSEVLAMAFFAIAYLPILWVNKRKQSDQ